MAIFIETNDADFNIQLNNFANKIANYGTALGLTTAEINSIKADAKAFDYVLGNQVAIQTFAHNYTTFKAQLRKGGTATLGALPKQPVFTTAPTMPLIGIESRFRALLQRITHQNGYTAAIGKDLGIDAPLTVFNAADGKPVFNITLSSGGYPNLHWTRRKFNGIEIWKDSGTGFIKLDRDMHPDFTDKTPLPAAGATAIWKYKMIYIINDEVIGHWSDVVSISVHGEV